MNNPLFIISEKIYESDNDLLYDLTKPLKKNTVWRNTIVLKKADNNGTVYHLIREEEDITTTHIHYFFYKVFLDKDEAIEEALKDAQFFNLR